MNNHLIGVLAVICIGTACLLPINARSQIPSASGSSATQAPASTSLKNKSDAELVQLITGRAVPAEPKEQVSQDNRLMFSPLDRLWEMEPRDAAVAFVTDYVSKDAAGIKFEIDDRNTKPPPRGEVGVRWISGNYYAMPAQGVSILKYDGYNSTLSVSEVEIVGRASKAEIEKAVMKTDSHPLYRLVAQQTYEILWWLRHVRKTGTQTGGRSATSSSVDDYGRFWMKPDGPVMDKVDFGEPCAECAADDMKEAYPRFAATLIRRLIERSGTKRRYPVPQIGKHFDPDEDAKFLHTPPPDRSNARAIKLWIGRLTDILRNPKRQYLHWQVMERLVPISDPLRYGDDHIEAALFDVLHRGLEAGTRLAQLEQIDRANDREPVIVNLDEVTKEAEAASEKKGEQRRKERRQLRDLEFNGKQAAEKLGFHDALNAFPELFRLAKDYKPKSLVDRNHFLIAAASIVGRHPELRLQLAEYLSQRLSTEEERTARGSPLLEAVWRADLREMTPTLEQLASLPRPAPNSDDSRESGIEKASLILTAWRETDLLTKTKIDALLNSVIGGGSSIPEVLRAEFEALPGEDKFTFRQFINWMRTAGATVQLHYLENTFTPHTPRPGIAFEH